MMGSGKDLIMSRLLVFVFLVNLSIFVSLADAKRANLPRQRSLHNDPFKNAELDEAFELINDYLIDNVEEEDNDPNLKAASKMLDDENVKPDSDQNQKLLKALRQFIALRELERDEAKCSQESFKILHDLNVATKGIIHKTKLDVPLRRVEQVFQRHEIEHTTFCLDLYKDNFKIKMDRFDSEKLNKIDLFMNILLTRRAVELSKIKIRRVSKLKLELFMALIAGKETVGGRRNAEIAYDSLKILSRNDPDAELIRDRTVSMKADSKTMRRLKIIVNRYLVEPCTSYFNEFDVGVFAEIEKSDISVLERLVRTRRTDKDASELFDSWARFGFCKAVVNDKASMMNHILAWAISKHQVNPNRPRPTSSVRSSSTQ